LLSACKSCFFIRIFLQSVNVLFKVICFFVAFIIHPQVMDF